MKIIPYNFLKPQDASQNVLPVAIISMEKDIGRRRELIKVGIPEEWVENYYKATDATTFSEKDKSENIDIGKMERFYNRSIVNGEIGCALSHRSILSWLADSHYDQLLILEDDVVPQNSNFLKKIEDLAENFIGYAKSGEDFIVHLGLEKHHVENTLKRKVIRDKKVIDNVFLHCEPEGGTLWFAHAYLISRPAAIKMLEVEKKISTLADDWGEKYKSGSIHKVFFVDPKIFSQSPNIKSTIGGNRTSTNTNQKHRSVEHKNHIFTYYKRIERRIKSVFPFYLKSRD